MLSSLNTLGFFTAAQTKAMVNISNWTFLLTFAGVGLSLQRSRMKAGIKPFVVGFGVETIVSVVTFAMVYLLLA